MAPLAPFPPGIHHICRFRMQKLKRTAKLYSCSLWHAQCDVDVAHAL